MRVDGLTVEQLKDSLSREKWTSTTTKMTQRMQPTLLEEDDECQFYHLQLNTPMILSNRSLFVAQYRVDHLDGSFTFVQSSKGNADLQEKYASMIGNNVVADMIIQYWHAKPHEIGEIAFYTLVPASLSARCSLCRWMLREQRGFDGSKRFHSRISQSKNGRSTRSHN